MNISDWGVLFLHCSKLFTPKTIDLIIEKFGSNFNTLQKLNESDLNNLNFKNQIIKSFLDFKKQFSIEELLTQCENNKIDIIQLNSPNYPLLLKQIHQPPKIIFNQGQLNNKSLNLAIVGSRKCTQYGKNQTAIIASELTSYLTLVSGLAYGIDQIAHTSATSKKKSTIAIIASGHLKCTYRENKISENILNNSGCIISEYPPNQPAYKFHFPIRNRLISGLSHGTLITEAAIKSGSLITARYALEQNRDIFALPGPVDSLNSAGTNQLIKQGANLITSAADILDFYNLNQQIKIELPNLSPLETRIIKLLKNQSLHINQIIEILQLDSASTISTLQLMDIKGLVKSLPNGVYQI